MFFLTSYNRPDRLFGQLRIKVILVLCLFKSIELLQADNDKSLHYKLFTTTTNPFDRECKSWLLVTCLPQTNIIIPKLEYLHEICREPILLLGNLFHGFEELFDSFFLLMMQQPQPTGIPIKTSSREAR